MKIFNKILVTTGLLGLVSSQSSFADVATTVEEKLTNLRQRTLAKSQDGCDNVCEHKIYSECGIYVPELTCYQDSPYPNTCSASGAFLNFEHAGGRCSNEVDCTDSQDRDLACQMADLFDSDDMKHDQGGFIVNQYVGFHNSFRMIYPYVHAKFTSGTTCEEYDPRYRPWYVGAATGAKNIVIILDASGSMTQFSRNVAAKAAAKSVIDTLGQQDWFTLITFGATASSSFTQLVQATVANKELAYTRIDSVVFTGGTNYSSAFDLAFQHVEATAGNELGSCGETIALFLTDGLPTAGVGSVTDANVSDADKEAGKDTLIAHLETAVAGNQNLENIKIFSFGLGDTSDEIYPSAIACAFNGVYTKTSDGSTSLADLKGEMRSYYNYLALGLEFTEPIWSEVYQDSTTGLDFVTAALPIYITNDASVQILLGVAGIDVNVADVNRFADYTTKIAELQARSRYSDSCVGSTELTNCQLNTLRPTEFQCPTLDGNGNVVQENCQDYETSQNDCPSPITANQWISSYPVDEDGNQIRYSNSELSACCPSDDNDPDNTSVLQFSMLLLVCIQIIALMI